MKVLFYIYSGKNNEINKQLGTSIEVDCVLKKTTNILNLSLILNFSSDNFNYNYCYIPKLKKYYFVENIGIVRNELISVDLKNDVLMSYKNTIKNSSAKVIECENNYNENYVSCLKSSRYKTKTIEIPLDFISSEKLVFITQK